MLNNDNEKTVKREEIPEQFKWALEDIYPTDNDWQADLEKLKAMPDRILSFKGKLGESAENLYDFMKLSEEISLLCDNLGNYAQRRYDENTANPKYQGFTGQLMNVYVSINSAGSFETPEIVGISDEIMDKFYKDKPELELYRKCFERIRSKREHILSDKEERLLAMTGEMGQAPESIYSMFSDADLKFKDIIDKDGKVYKVTHASYVPLMQNNDRDIREKAFCSMYEAYGSFRNTCAAVLNSQVKAQQFYADARNYSSALNAALEANEVPVEVYYNLIDTVHNNMDYMYDYVKLRKKLLGVSQLHFYDLYAPIVSDCEMKIPFDEAKETVLKALEPMGEEYISIIKEGFDNRWIDVYENEGKTSGAYSAGAKVHPYVLLNYKDTLNCMFTLAHEMGHAAHSYLSNKNQPNVYSDYVIFVAEVASTCNEALLMQYLLNNTNDKKEKAYLINYFLEQFRTTLYRQTMFAEFELKINEISQEGRSVTAEECCEIYGELNRFYFGEQIVLDEQIKLEWARIPHFYYDFYVYQYATGYSAAIALSQRILSGGEKAVKDYLTFLKGGCSQDPISLLKIAGVDMSKPEPINEALKMFGELVKELDEIMACDR